MTTEPVGQQATTEQGGGTDAAVATLAGTITAVTDLVRASVWPAIVLIMLAVFWGPAHSAMDQLPEVLGRTKTVTIAGLTLEIDSRLEALGVEPSAETEAALAALTSTDVARLMSFSSALSGTRRSHDPAEMIRPLYVGLIDAGLVKELSPAELDDFSYGVSLTVQGREAVTFLNGVVGAFVAELPKPGA
ncbi:MAG: hypothetical protein R3B59_08715 [Dehalococcoidia bacterium]